MIHESLNSSPNVSKPSVQAVKTLGKEAMRSIPGHVDHSKETHFDHDVSLQDQYPQTD